MKYYQIPVDRVLSHFATTSERGLTAQQAAERLEKDGPNSLPEAPQESIIIVFLRQFQSPLIYILLIAAAIIFFVGHHLDAFIISGVLFFNAIIGTIQEGRTRSILHGLKQFLKTHSVVVRDGKRQIVDDTQLVVGDIIVLQEGEKVPADARIIQSYDLGIDEAILTGESKSVYKSPDLLEGERKIFQQTNMVFKGTYVLSGSGRAVVVATGQHTQVGQLQKSVEDIETDTPLKKEVDQLAHWILIFILLLCVCLFFIGLWFAKPFAELLTMLTALFICVIPEGLPVVFTLVLVTGALRMAKQNVLVKRLQAVEALGRAQVIMIDKTGTLTRNEMIVSRVFADNTLYTVSGQGYFIDGNVLRDGTPIDTDNLPHDLKLMGHATSLLDRSELRFEPKLNLFRVKGDPTDAALYTFSQKLDINVRDLEHEYILRAELPFDSRYKKHVGFYNKDGQNIVFVAGAPELVLRDCTNGSEEHRTVLAQFLEEGLRVVGIAYGTFNADELPESEDKVREFYEQKVAGTLTFLGFAGIEDSIREDVADIVAQARQSGLEIVMATGDHRTTAEYVARNVGILQPGDAVVTGEELASFSDAELSQRLNAITVYARVTPEEKLRIVKAYKQQNKIIAMTGDGVNDAPALIAADLGIAMGNIGTEVAKQAADMILLDDSFASIVQAIKEGRHIFYTLRRVILYFFTTNFGEVLVVMIALVLNLPLPILAAQILWLNLITDGFLDAALSMEPQEPGLLQRTWLQRAQKSGLVDASMVIKMFYMALPMALGSMLAFARYYQTDLALARTMTMVTMAMFQWFNAWNCRSEKFSIFTLGLFTNRWLLLATTFVFGLQILVVHNPVMQMIFKTVPLTLDQWLAIIGISSSLLVVEELRKLFVHRWYKSLEH